MQRIGKYEIVRELGRGSMGKVFEARHPIIGNSVAIKVIHAIEYADARELASKQKRLFDEARRAGALSHPNIVTIHDVDVEGELAYIVMEFVRGNCLEDRLEPSKPYDTEMAIALLKQIASALDCAHARGIIHRDIKPANIMITTGDQAKVADFGIAKDLGEQGATKTGMVMGTPYYMAPEQIQGLALSGRTDQFALAVIAYRMLTGVRAFDGETLTTIMYRIIHEQPRPAQEFNPSLNPAVAAVLHQALAKNPADRFESCGMFADALERSVMAAPVQAAVAPTIQAPVAMPRNESKLMWLVGAPVFVVIVAGAVFGYQALKPKAAIKAQPEAQQPASVRPAPVRSKVAETVVAQAPVKKKAVQAKRPVAEADLESEASGATAGLEMQVAPPENPGRVVKDPGALPQR